MSAPPLQGRLRLHPCHSAPADAGGWPNAMQPPLTVARHAQHLLVPFSCHFAVLSAAPRCLRGDCNSLQPPRTPSCFSPAPPAAEQLCQYHMPWCRPLLGQRVSVIQDLPAINSLDAPAQRWLATELYMNSRPTAVFPCSGWSGGVLDAMVGSWGGGRLVVGRQPRRVAHSQVDCSPIQLRAMPRLGRQQVVEGLQGKRERQQQG